jgi:hypothetical protein
MMYKHYFSGRAMALCIGDLFAVTATSCMAEPEEYDARETLVNDGPISGTTCKLNYMLQKFFPGGFVGQIELVNHGSISSRQGF